jgi:hypothetical protein
MSRRAHRPLRERRRSLAEEAAYDDPANYEETIVSLTAEPICPECAQGKHGNCVGQAFNDMDQIVSCYCPTCGAGDA